MEEKKLSSEDRVKLIRKGNQLFNEGKIEEAAKIFWLTDYSDGLIRVGEYLMYDEKKPFQALLYFQKAHYKPKIEEIYARMIWALQRMVSSDSSPNIEKK